MRKKEESIERKGDRTLGEKDGDMGGNFSSGKRATGMKALSPV